MHWKEVVYVCWSNKNLFISRRGGRQFQQEVAMETYFLIFPIVVLCGSFEGAEEKKDRKPTSFLLLAMFCRRRCNNQPVSGASVEEWYLVIGT